MSDPFHTHIEQALQNEALHSALDANAERRRLARQQAYTSLPEDLQVRRRRAHTARADTIANLDRYLAQFSAQVQANGMQVHPARDAAQALQIILEIAHQAGARTVAKSKTMVGEEIAINPALEQAGLQVVETDLGEYIVQLRGEHPAHIITPAVHLRRQDVGRTFHEKLGLPMTEDIPTMTAAARRILRQTFLDADLGISGVNFGVAESGTLCIVTNEGNGRMVTTLPRVHIALMGIERLVPDFATLELMLSLLPRSATGQKLTVYTQLINAPRRPGEVDGAQQRHLVLLDNGRQAMRDSWLAEMLYCIRCGACLNACPVFREIGGHAYVGKEGQATAYPGPMGSIVSPGLFGQSEFGQLARASSLCGACREACPVDIDLPKLLLRVRAGGLPASPPSQAQPQPDTPLVSAPGAGQVPPALNWGLHIYSWMAASPGRFRLAQRLAGLLSRLVAPFSSWLRLPAFSGWGLSRDFPRPARQTFQQRWAAGKINTPLSQEAAKRAETQNQAASELQAASRDQQASDGQALLDMAQSELIERFKQEFEAVGGNFTICREAELPDQILSLLSAQQASRVTAWEKAEFPQGLLTALTQGGIQIGHQPDPHAQAGLTGALAGVAETGSLIVPSGPGRPATASLLPERHLVVLPADAIVPSLARALSLPQLRQASTTALITGPSRTADIEMTLTIGVHGPGAVHVFCVVPE